MTNRILFTFLGIAFLIPHNSSGFFYHSVLTEDDLAFEAADREHGPALSSALDDPDSWESYNQWMCFQSKDIEVLRVEVEYDGKTKSVPQIDAENDGHLFQISLDGDIDGQFDRMFERWRQIVNASNEVCVYAAFLQKGPLVGKLTSSLWVVEHIKGDTGEWSLDEALNSTPEQSTSQRQFGDYTVTISSSEDHMEEALVIEKSGRVVFKESASGSHFFFGNFTDETDSDPYSGMDINGNLTPDLVISKWTGGAHCCNFLYVFELGKNFRHVVTVEGGSYPFKFIDLDDDKIPEIEFSEGAIDYQFASFAYSPPGRVVLKFKDDHYEVADGLMRKSLPSMKNISHAENLIRREFQKHDSPELPYPLLKLMMNLSYSGHLDAALAIADQTWPSQKQGLQKFKGDFKQALFDSPYWAQFNRK